MSPTGKRIFGLDLLRCIAIIFVLFTHSAPVLKFEPLYKVSVYTGYLGVELFFVLSGFLIGTILLKIYSGSNEFSFKSIRLFWIRRWFRTLPNYYLMFVIYALIAVFAHHINVFGDIKYLSYLVFLQNSVSYQPNNFFQVAWSLSIEEWFYLMFPVVLFLVSKKVKTNGTSPFLLTVLSFIVIELAARLLIALIVNHPWDEGFRKLMPLRLDGIDIGVLAAYTRFKYLPFWNKNARLMANTGAALLTTLTVYFAADYLARFDNITWDHNLKPGIFLETLFFTLTSFSIALFIPYLYNIKVQKSIFSKSVAFISKISYSIYLTHWLVILALTNIFKHFPNTRYANMVLFMGIWIVIILLAGIQYSFFERRVTSLREKFSSEQSAIGMQTNTN